MFCGEIVLCFPYGIQTVRMFGVTHTMPTHFLTKEQRESYGRYAKPPSPAELARYFHLDGSELATVQRMRGFTNRVGFATLLCSVRFVGAFPVRGQDVPEAVITYLGSQLNRTSEAPSLETYFNTNSPTYKRHTKIIRDHFGYRDFHQTPAIGFGLSRRIYDFCWSGEERSGHLIQWAGGWLIEHKVVFPGVSTLERLVGRIRERARTRLWRCLVEGLTVAQRVQIDALFRKEDERFGDLEVLRSNPLKRRQTDFLRHLDRLDALRAFGLQLTPPKGVPATQLERLARIARVAKPSAIAALKEPRRTATVAALFYTLEATAQDDATELGEALVADLFRDAEQAQARTQATQQRDLDKAALLLRDLAGMLISDSDMPFTAWQSAVYAHWPKDNIKAAMATVDSIIQPTSPKPVIELNKRWRRARKLFFNITTRIDLAAAPGGQQVTEAVNWLREQKDWSKPAMKKAPTAVLSKSWRPYVLGAGGRVADPRAYVFATIDAWRKAVKRRDVFAAPGIRYGDPRKGMLERREWQNAKGIVCRTLNRSLDGPAEVGRLTELLDATFNRVAARAPQNSSLRFEVANGRPRIVIAPLDRLDEPDSLIALRRQIHRLMPKGGIPDILLEVMSRSGFANAFTHLSDRPTKVDGFEISLCAALVAQACNIGFEPLVRDDHPALRQSRMSWIGQNFIRPETLAAANARIVSAHRKLPIVAHWGDGQTASADGLRFIAPKSAIHAGPNPKYFGQGRGVTWYNMLSDQYSGLGAMVIPGTLRDSLGILALLLEQQTELDPVQVMTDNAAYSDSIFGLFWLLGYQFCPRLADIGGARLWRVDKTANYGSFNPIAEGTINIKLIIENWEDLVRLAGSLKLGHLKAASVMRILQVKDHPTTLARALMQLGRLIKSLHILNYIDDEKFRRRILVQLNRQEFRHKLARKIYHGDRGEVRNALRQGQEEQLGALGLALNAVTHWNAIYMQEALALLTMQGLTIDPADIARLSPVLWRHISFLGRYEVALPDCVAQGGLRPLSNLTFEQMF